MSQAIDLLQSNLLTPVVLAFVLGAIAHLLKSDLRIPESLFTGLSIYLLLAIGLKGGHELSKVGIAEIWKPAAATLLLGVIVPVICFFLARGLIRLEIADAAALAAHYGSVSAVTFAAVIAFLDASRIAYEGFMPALVALLEAPAIVVAIVLARVAQPQKDSHWSRLLHEVLTGKSIVLLLGGLVIGTVCTPVAYEKVRPMFNDLFYGILVLFMLEMGLIAASRLLQLPKGAWKLIPFAILLPLLNGTIGAYLGHAAGLSLGGNVTFAVMAASASYIAAPAAVRIALPEANPGIYLTAAIGITFPFNLAIGIPVLYELTRLVRG